MAHNPYSLDIYAAISTDSHIYIKCRLLRNSLFDTDYDTSILKSVMTSFKAAMSNELGNTPLMIYVDDHEISLVTDHEGYIEWMTSDADILSHRRSKVYIVLEGSDDRYTIDLMHYNGQLADGIISDIDDTILMTNVKSFFKLKMLVNSVFINPFRRKPIMDSSEFYQKLRGETHLDMPIIYISNSPWNMYYYLRSFLKHNNFPSGILLLRDFGLQMLRKKKPLEYQNKYLSVEKMFKIFPNTRFTLIGDSAEYDYDIYTKLMYSYPDRVSRIIIKTASNTKNELRISESIGSHMAHNVQLVSSYTDVVL